MSTPAPSHLLRRRSQSVSNLVDTTRVVPPGLEDPASQCVKCESRGCSCFKAICRIMPCVGRGLFISGSRGVTMPNVLRSRKVTHVLNAARELESVDFPDFVEVFHAGLRDAEDEDLFSRLPELVGRVHQVINSGGRMVVNCVAGVSRSASICLAYKVAHEGRTLREAFDEIRTVHPVISPNPGFWRALVRWEEGIRGGESSVVLKPYISGMAPELQEYEEWSLLRVRFAWMDDLVRMFAVHLVILCLQAAALLWL